ncbi:MAG: DUF58 domain-containing protein [Puniceicoccales bacterium]|jgi:uncharacterized protein (DUF58 family)|nr:DUF58 domain-containing protein [Puniceicoccales bacterium]
MSEPTANANLLDPDALAKGENLGILARTIIEGYRVGNHRSPFRGFAIEFAQHREYTVGDDTRHLDWKVLGRTDHYYIKQYEQDTNLTVHFLLDGSESMTYGSARYSKFHYAKALAACLAYLVLLQRDSVSVNLFDTATREHIPRTDNLGKIHHIMNRLAAFDATQGTNIGAAMTDLAKSVKARGIVFVFSDIFDDEEGFLHGLRQLRFLGHEVVVFHVLDHNEIEFPLTGRVEFLGLEGNPTLVVSPASIRKSYLREMNAMRQRIKQACDQARFHYVLADTAVPLAETLSAYLVARQENTTIGRAPGGASTR